MSDTETTEGTEEEAGRIQSIADLTSKVDKLTELVERFLPTHAEAQAHTEKRLNRATTAADQAATVAELTRDELRKAREEEAAEQAAAAEHADRETVRQRLAKLEEAPPAPPVRRTTRLLGWGDGR